MCKAYGGEPNVELLRAFLNLGPAGSFVQPYNHLSCSLSNLSGPILYLAGLKTSLEHSAKDPVIYYRRKEMDFRSFKMEVIDGEFNFLSKEDIGNEGGGSLSVSITTKARTTYVEPLNAVDPSQFAKNIVDSDDAPSEKDDVKLIDRKATGKPSDPLDVDRDPNIHGKLSPFIHLVVTYVTPPSWKHHLKEISLENICDIHDKAYMRQVVLDNVVNRRTRELISTLLEARVACNAIWEREKEKDKIETLQGQEIDGLKQNRVAMVAKVVLHVAAERARSDEMGFHVTRLIKMTIIHGRCTTFEEVATLKIPFKLEKMPNYRPFSKKEFDQAGDDLAAASYPFLAEAIVDPYTPLEVLLSNKPKSLCVKSAPSYSQSKSKPSSSKIINQDS
ncbi:hypothetical protein Tco_0153249 [Tanacetum coccineum]